MSIAAQEYTIWFYSCLLTVQAKAIVLVPSYYIHFRNHIYLKHFEINFSLTLVNFVKISNIIIILCRSIASDLMLSFVKQILKHTNNLFHRLRYTLIIITIYNYVFTPLVNILSITALYSSIWCTEEVQIASWKSCFG